jgi:hypothetical protein
LTLAKACQFLLGSHFVRLQKIERLPVFPNVEFDRGPDRPCGAVRKKPEVAICGDASVLDYLTTLRRIPTVYNAM